MEAGELGQLLSLVSHEVRAPLGVMRGYLRLIEQQSAELPEHHRHAVTAALRAGDRAADILGQLSTLARMHRGEIVATRTPTALEPLLRASLHAVAMPPEPIVTVHVGETPAVSIAADEDLLKFAISALTSAVVRAQAADCRVFLMTREDARDGRPGVTLTIAPTEAVNASDEQAPLDVLRGGLALELPIASFIVSAHQGIVMERREHDRFAGIIAWVPRS